MQSQPDVVPTTEPASGLDCDVLVVPAFESPEGPRLAGDNLFEAEFEGMLAEALRDAAFKGREGEVFITPTFGHIPARSVAVAGLGSGAVATPAQVRKAAGAAARRMSGRSVAASILHLGNGDGAAAASVEGFLLGAHRADKRQSPSSGRPLQRLMLPGAGEPAVEAGLVRARATIMARDLVNEPASDLTPSALADRARAIADVGGLGCSVLEENDLMEGGFGGVLGVARGSAEPPRLIHLTYTPEGSKGRIALVGKGVTFDSGGLSIKDARSMEAMKTDMAGAAAVLGAMSALPVLKPRVHVDAYIPSVENMPGSRAIRPGDVIRHYGGRTVEVLNTDAEGRLILGDALAYASESSPDAIVDAATLTGTISLALGNKCAGLFANEDGLAGEIEEAADRAGERVWRLPLIDEYHSLLDSPVADARNRGSRYGGAIIAALFLRDFVASGVPWAHLDIAGTARSDTDYDEVGKGGTGSITRTLINFVEARGL